MPLLIFEERLRKNWSDKRCFTHSLCVYTVQQYFLDPLLYISATTMLVIGGSISKDVEWDKVGGCAQVVAVAKGLLYNGANADSRTVNRCMVVWAGQGKSRYHRWTKASEVGK
jgi:hypothetical protein